MSDMNRKIYILPTNEPEIDALKVVGNQDWFQIIGCFVDETSKIDKNYSQIILWQIWNSAENSVRSFQSNADHYKKMYEDSFINQRASASGREIDEQNDDFMLKQGKTWKALCDKYKSISDAVVQLYEQLYDMHPKDRKITKQSKGTVRTIKDMTPKEIEQTKEMSAQAFGY